VKNKQETRLNFSRQTRHYEKTLGASHFGRRAMVVETQATLKLINKYFPTQ